MDTDSPISLDIKIGCIISFSYLYPSYNKYTSDTTPHIPIKRLSIHWGLTEQNYCYFTDAIPKCIFFHKCCKAIARKNKMKFEMNCFHAIFSVWSLPHHLWNCPQVIVTGDKSTFVQVMALCRQVLSHYLNQCWPGSMSSYDGTWPQWVKAWMCQNEDLLVSILDIMMLISWCFMGSWHQQTWIGWCITYTLLAWI